MKACRWEPTLAGVLGHKGRPLGTKQNWLEYIKASPWEPKLAGLDTSRTLEPKLAGGNEARPLGTNIGWSK